MDWISIGTQLAKLGAPMLASVFLGPEAGALTTMAINKLSTALGVPPTPEAVQTAITTDPDAAAKVQAVEQAHADTIAAYLQDVQNARSTNVQMVQAGSSIAYGPVVVSVIITIGFFGLLTTLMFAHLDDTSTRVQAILNVILGTLAAGFTQTINYWLGSSAGSQAKDLHLAELARAPTVQAQPGAHVNASTIRGK